MQGAFHALSWEKEKVSCDGNAKKDMGRVSTAKALTLLLFGGRRVGSIGFAESRVKHGRASDSKQSGPLFFFFPLQHRHGERKRQGIARIQMKDKKRKEKGRMSQPN